MPTEDQISADDSRNLLEYDEGGLTQSDFLAEMTVQHPLLLAKQKLDKTYIHRSIAKAPPKR